MSLNFEVPTVESGLAGWGMSVIFDDLHELSMGRLIGMVLRVIGMPKSETTPA